MSHKIKIILSGGGTAGHIYPAVAIAEEYTKRYGDQVDILFVGAEGKMEMTRVSSLGYKIVGLPIRGLIRSLSVANLKVALNSVKSYIIAKKLLKEFSPDIVMGFGGYASFPLLLAAQSSQIKTVIWEGNSYAGLANRILSKRATKIVVAFDDMSRFFDPSKTLNMGNPLRGDFSNIEKKSLASKNYFNFDKERPTLLVTGGSLGAGALNQAVIEYINEIALKKEINLIWQTGSYYYDRIKESTKDIDINGNIWISPFIEKMKYGYEAADLVIARSGASSVTELSLAGCATIFVPSANVTDDHQTKNAESLVKNDAAILIKDDVELTKKLIPEALKLLKNRSKIEALSKKIKELANGDAATNIVDMLERLRNNQDLNRLLSNDI